MQLRPENFNSDDLEALVIGLLINLNLKAYNPEISIAENVINAISNS